MKMGKRNGKRKKKKDSQLAGSGGGGIWPSRARARARAGGPLGLPAGNGAETAPWAWAHVPEEGGLTAWSGDGGGRTSRGSTAGEAPRRFSAGVPVLRRGSGGEARAGVGDHGGGPIWLEGAWGGQSTVRWQALAAVRSPARPTVQ
jgi:hypothetical protein